MLLNNLLRHLVLIQQFCQIIYARSGSGTAYRRGSYIHASGHHPGFVWFPHLYGHRYCDDDDTECQQTSSVHTMDVVILTILVILCMCCCCICAAYAMKKNNTRSVSNGSGTEMTTENYNPYVSMQEPQQRCCRSVTPFNQEQRPNQVVIVQGQSVTPSNIVEIAYQQQNATQQIV
jgi:hypothetical protein